MTFSKIIDVAMTTADEIREATAPMVVEGMTEKQLREKAVESLGENASKLMCLDELKTWWNAGV